MNHHTDESAVHDYLAALEARLAQLPTDQSEEVLFGVREHIAEALERGGQSTSEILAGLGSPDDIAAGLTGAGMDGPGPAASSPYASGPYSSGSHFPNAASVPGTIQYPNNTPPAAPGYQSSTVWVVATCILLPFGGFLAGIGWLFGVAGLWLGTRWKTWEKIMGTVLFPGGLVGSLWMGLVAASAVGTTTSATVTTGMTNGGVDSAVNPLLPVLPGPAAVALILLPLAVAVYLLVVGLRRGPATK